MPDSIPRLGCLAHLLKDLPMDEMLCLAPSTELFLLDDTFRTWMSAIAKELVDRYPVLKDSQSYVDLLESTRQEESRDLDGGDTGGADGSA